MASMSVSGVVSGMDWDSMIDEIITNAAKPAQVKVARKTNLTNKKSLFEEMKVTMNSLQSSLSPLKLPSTYKAKEINIERIDTSGSYKGVLTATVNADAEVNVWDVKVNKLATAQINRSKQITSSTLASTLNGLTSSTFYVNMGGQKVGIEVNATDSLQALKSRINNTLKTLSNPLAVTASVVDNKLILKSDDTGLGTRTAAETINYSSSGINRLTNMSVNASDASNLKITKGSKSYTYGTDFTVANGNEIRWKQYDRGTEVALNDKVNVKYRMAAGDVYEKTGTYGTSEATISGVDMIYNGTLGSRLKIKDSEGNTYTYGEDFTIENNKVVWLDEEESKTYEPDTYTVSYSKTTTETASAGGIKSGTQAAPTSYTVSYSKELISPVSVTAGENFKVLNSSLAYSILSNIDGLTSSDVSAATTTKYIVPEDESEFTLTDGTTEYVYGKDYIIRSAPASVGSNNSILSWYGNVYTIGSTSIRYIDDYAGTPVLNVNPTPTSGTLLLSYTHAYKSQNGLSSDVLAAADTDYENINITDADGNSYTYGTDFTITDGKIEWLIKAGSDVDDDIDPDDFADLKEKYNAYAGNDSDADLPTVTLLDSDGVVRTYFDPADRSLFTMTATDSETGDTVSYEYGRDYVIRVNDTGDGYVFSWAVTGDKNQDGTVDIKDANTEATTYTAAKGISTSGWKAAPSADSPYSFDFTYTGTTTASKTVNASDSDTDKTIANIFSGITVDPADYNDSSVITITDSSGNTYTPGAEYTIDSAGKITWLEKTNELAPSSFTVDYKLASATGTVGSNTYTAVSEQNFSGYSYSGFAGAAGADTVQGISAAYQYLDLYGNAKASMTINNSTLEYGQSYVIRQGGTSGNAIFDFRETRINDYRTHRDPAITKDDDAPSYGVGDEFTFAYTISTAKGSDDLSSVVSTFAEKYASGFQTADDFVLTGSNGVTYSYNASVTSASDLTQLADNEFAIVNGAIRFKVSEDTAKTHPADGSEYTLYYEAFSALTAEGTYDGSSSQEVSIKVDSGSGNYRSTSLSYEQILSDLSLTSSSATSDLDTKFAENFTLTDDDGNEYVYGTDFTITQGTNTDSTKGEHSVVINWLGNTPSGDFTLTYKGCGDAGEVITTDGVQRSTKDTIDPDTSSVLSGLYSTFSGASDITITDGTNTYKLYTDFTISQSTDGLSNPVIVWNPSSDWFSQDTTSAASFNVYVNPSSGATLSYTGTRAAGSNDLTLDLGSPDYYSSSDFDGGTNTITQGAKTFYENEDFIFMDDSEGHAQVYWLNDRSGGTEWFYPNPGTQYTINHTDSSGNVTSYTASRSASTALDMSDYGMTTANGSLTVQYGDGNGMLLDAEPDYQTDSDGNYVLDDDGNKIPVANTDGHAAIKAQYSIDIKDRGNGSYVFNWVTPTLTSRSGLPSIGDELTVEYEYDANTFTLTDNGDGLLDLLGLNDDVTEAQDAELEIDGQTVTRASNDIGADYDNELIKGVTMHLKGVGEVSLDIVHDAEKAVESIQNFVDTYNDLMSWINTRMTESQLDEDTKATVDSDDFRMRWGLLHGNALLRNTKSQMRSLVSQNFTFSFTQRKSSSEIYGNMAYNGLKSSSTLRLRIGTKYVDVTIDPSDTLQTIAAKINDDTKGGPMNDIYYDEAGNKLQTPLLRVSTDNDILTINSTSNDEITMSGSAAMNALKMNYTYKGLYQIGIETTSDDYGKSGELVFDSDEFMTALEDNPDEVQELMLKFVTQFDTWTKGMLNSSASGETSGTLTREIENIQTQIDSINEYLETYQERLDRMEKSLRNRYGSTETQLSRLTQQASSIAAILNQLNGTASSSSSSSS